MPLIRILFRDPIESWVANSLANDIGRIVAEALTCSHPDGHLTQDDIEVDVEPMPCGLRTKYDLHIEVEANDFPQRRRNLRKRQSRILAEVRFWFKDHSARSKAHTEHPNGWVWVKLFRAEWSEI